MNNSHLSFFLRPFNDLTTLLKIVQIIKLKHSPLRENIGEIITIVKTMLGLTFSFTEIKELITLMHMFSHVMGYDFFNNQSTIKNEIHYLAASRNEITISLIPSISKCTFVQLIKEY